MTFQNYVVGQWGGGVEGEGVLEEFQRFNDVAGVFNQI